MPESLLGRVLVTQGFREGVQLYMFTRGLYMNEYAAAVGLDRAILRRILPGRMLSVRPQIIGKLVRGLGLSRREDVYMFSLVGWQLPLFDDLSSVWEPGGSIGSRIDGIVVDVGLNGPQRKTLADILIPNALALARLIKLGLSPQGEPLAV